MRVVSLRSEEAHCLIRLDIRDVGIAPQRFQRLCWQICRESLECSCVSETERSAVSGYQLTRQAGRVRHVTLEDHDVAARDRLRPQRRSARGGSGGNIAGRAGHVAVVPACRKRRRYRARRASGSEDPAEKRAAARQHKTLLWVRSAARPAWSRAPVRADGSFVALRPRLSASLPLSRPSSEGRSCRSVGHPRQRRGQTVRLLIGWKEGGIEQVLLIVANGT